MRSKQWAITMVWLLFASTLPVFCSMGQAQSKGVPELVLEETVHDFGQVKQGDVLEHSFVIRNQGTAPLQIKNVRPG